MKKIRKLCIIYTENNHLIEAIDEFFTNNSTIDITCLHTNKKEAEHTYKNITTQTIEEKNLSEYFTKNSFDLILISNYQKEYNREIFENGLFINIHPSLLPAFPEKEAIKNAYLAGVKVSGITIHSLEKDFKKNKIIAQYPVLISNIMHFEEFRQSIENLEKNITPIVISKLLDGKLFDFQDLLAAKKHSCSGDCNNCTNCH